MSAEQPHCGFVAVLGAPNAGKSTLVNRFVDAKISIVSPKVQTTRTRVMGIFIRSYTQLVFIDTPGIFAPRRRLDRAMVAAAWGGAGDADTSILLVDAKEGINKDTRRILEGFKNINRPAILAINKVDLVEKSMLLKLADEINRAATFSNIFMISAQNGSGVDDLLAFLVDGAPPGPWHFPEDQISDMPQRLFAAEITREKLYLQLRQELPYAATVETESWTENDDGSVRIDQVIYVERDTQKAIVLGKGGQRIKSLGAAARTELETLLDRRVHLFLFVKVRQHWDEDPERYRSLGLDYNA